MFSLLKYNTITFIMKRIFFYFHLIIQNSHNIGRTMSEFVDT